MKDIEKLTNIEIEKEIVKIFNNNSWVLRPNFDKLSSEEIEKYQYYEDLQIILATRYRKKNYFLNNQKENKVSFELNPFDLQNYSY